MFVPYDTYMQFTYYLIIKRMGSQMIPAIELGFG